MSASPLALGRTTLALAKSVKITAKNTPIEPLLGYDSKVVQYDTIDPMKTIEVEFEGDIPAGVATGSALTGGKAITGVTGGVTMIESVKQTERNRGYNSGSFKAIHAPSAT